MQVKVVSTGDRMRMRCSLKEIVVVSRHVKRDADATSNV